MYQLRTYQKDAVNATISHFQKSNDPAVVVLPTGAGKSLVIAELAKIANRRVLILAHVKELVEQNAEKFNSYGLNSGIYSAGLLKKESDKKIIFGSIQSVANAGADFFNDAFSLLIIDECHRVSIEGDTQYLHVIAKLKEVNPELCILGLTATPYRLGLGWIYEYHCEKKLLRTKGENRFFKNCIYELSLGYMIKNQYLTPPIKIDSPVACYDFSQLELQGNRYSNQDIEAILKDQSRITPTIIKNIVDISLDRQGVMIFTSSVAHAFEIMKSLPMGSAIVTGETSHHDRDEIIQDFKLKRIKFLVNVSVLTTGFDAPHVDVIAILRPTESVSLYQQIVGRGLRLSPGKTDCLVLDYTGQGHDIFSPEIDDHKPTSDSVVVDVACPQCGLINQFWGVVEDGEIIEHFGRMCQGAFYDDVTLELEKCAYRFRFKRCDQCGAENDIAAKMCNSCQHLLVDNDKTLKEAMSLKDAHVMKPDTMTFSKTFDKKGRERIEVRYYDFDGEHLEERFYLNSPEDSKAFYFNFIRMHNRMPEKYLQILTAQDVLDNQNKFRKPRYVIARKVQRFWEIREKIF